MKTIYNSKYLRYSLLILVLSVCIIQNNFAADPHVHPFKDQADKEKMTPNPDATLTIDGIVSEVLRIINGEKGKARDLDSFRNLFLPTAHFTVHTHDESMPQAVETVSLEDFIEILKDPYYDQDFEEKELSKLIDEYNGIAHVFQTYHVKDADGVEEIGLNSLQLIYFDNRWWIVNVMWTGNSNGVEVPKKYLGTKPG